MAARHDENQTRQRDVAMFQKDRFDVTGQMMNGDQPLVQRRGRSLRVGDTDEQGSDETRSLSDGDCINACPRGARVSEGPLSDATDVAHVLPRCDLGNNASPLTMDLDLRRNDVRINTPRMRRVVRRRHDGGRSLITRRFDPQNLHG